MNDLPEKLSAAVASGQLLESAKANIESLLAGASSDIPMNSVKELVEQENFSELNDRFFKTLAFGTGGLRGRTIGRNITKTEQGAGGPTADRSSPAWAPRR